ncbi:hypothetical protein ACAW74_09525 [Fibrella sp. WM1]|uniref:hypothetical protein n=1 Tax=Fibrella musci TaxID=3242485 RepID=UPI003521F8DC
MTDERTRKQLTAAEFIDIWANKFVGVKKEDGKGYWEGQHQRNEHIAIIESIELSEDLVISDRKGLSHLIVRNCKFHKIEVINSTIKDLFVENQCTIDDIKIHNKSTLEVVKIIESVVAGNIYIHSSTVEELSIDENTNIESINISASILRKIQIRRGRTSDIYISNKSKIEYISISNGTSIRDIEIYDDSTIDRIYLRNKTTIGNLLISTSKLDSIHINDEVETGYINIDRAIISNSLTIQGESKIYGINFQAKELRKLSLNDSYIQIFNWRQDTLCIVNVNRCQIERLAFTNTIVPKDSVFQFGECDILHFYFKSFTNTAWLNISGLKPLTNYLRFQGGSDTHAQQSSVDSKYNWVKGYSLEKTSLTFIASDLGKTSLVDCRLDKFVFYNTKLLEVFVAGTQLPKQISLPEGKTAQHEQNEQERLAFGQFKRIYENRGDTVSATDYLALEMDAYHRYLKQPEVIREKGSTWAERFTIELNRVSSYHNTNWFQAVAMTLGINGIMFAIYCYFLGYEPYVPFYSKIDWHTTLNLFSYSFEFLNPLRKADFLDKVNLEPVRDSWDWVARFWDYVSRIVVAYFVYQTVQAFRRYGKTK